MIEFEVRHTADSLRQVYTEWWRRRFGRAYSVAFGLAVFAFMMMLLIRAAPWWLVSATTLIVAYAAFLTLLRDNAIRLVLGQLELQGDGPLKYRVSETGIEEDSKVGHVQLRWPAFHALVRQSSAVLLLRRPKETNAFIVFPLAQIPPEAQAFMEERLHKS